MAELLFWQNSGYADSLNTALFVATQLKSQGTDVTVLFDEAATAALAAGKFDISPPLSDDTKTLEANVTKMGMSMDPMDYLKQAKSAGVSLVACAGWCDFLGVREKIPTEVQVMEMPDVFKLIAEAKRIIGGP
jgi:predicted peroxiredoxin